MTTTTLPNLGVRLRWVLRQDMPAVLSIEAASFAEPWQAADFSRCLRRRTCIGYVAEASAGGVVGYTLYDLESDHLRVVNLAVSPAVRGRGVGAELVRKIVHKAVTHRRGRIDVTVGERNDVALAFFRAWGFRATGVAWGRFTGGDGIDMSLDVEAAR